MFRSLDKILFLTQQPTEKIYSDTTYTNIKIYINTIKQLDSSISLTDERIDSIYKVIFPITNESP